MRRPNDLHRQLTGRHQLCGSDVGRLLGPRQSTVGRADGKTLGFINPAIYNIGLGSNYLIDFHDITSGSNGFSATVGYDLVTGWGSPNGPALVNALAGTVPAGFTLSSLAKYLIGIAGCLREPLRLPVP